MYTFSHHLCFDLPYGLTKTQQDLKKFSGCDTTDSYVQFCPQQKTAGDHTYILLTKRKGCTRRISAQVLDSTDQLQWGLYSPWNDPQIDPEMIPTPKWSPLFFLSTPKWSPRNYGMVIKHGTVDCSIIRESKDILAYVVNWFTAPILTTKRE